MAQNSSHLIWIDLEMTGLELRHDTIIEIATLVTDVNLNVIEEGPVLAIHQSDEVLEAMNEWNTTHHGQSGLTERVRQSKIDIKTAELSVVTLLVKIGNFYIITCLNWKNIFIIAILMSAP